MRKVRRVKPRAATGGTALRPERSTADCMTREGARPAGRGPRDMTETAEYLREQARRCRRLAKSVITADVVKTLTGMAEEYESRADRLEAEAREKEG